MPWVRLRVLNSDPHRGRRGSRGGGGITGYEVETVGMGH